jgi:hypothetical protein
MSGSSATPLAKKLGYKPDQLVRLINAPGNYLDLIGEATDKTLFVDGVAENLDMIHYFETSAEILNSALPLLKNQIKETGSIWISWYKKSAKQQTDITEDVVRHIALRAGFVDVKVCAVDDQWSGLKLVIPVRCRTPL